MTEETKVKGNALRRGLTAVIVLAVVFALLIVGYFVILRPYLESDQAEATEPVELIWSQEVASIDNRMLIYEHITREEMQQIAVHNPDNEKYGSQYVDWGFFRYTGEEEDIDKDLGLTVGDFYLTGYEYAAFDETVFSYLVTAAGYTLANSRVEDHCTDFSRYGLDYATPEEATSLTVTATDGRVYTYYIGDKLPSGSGYYVRCINEDTPASGGEAIQRDSVYVFPATYLDAAVLLTPQKLVDPYLTMPVNTSSYALIDDFVIWRREDKYLSPKLDENGNQEYDEDGTPITRWEPMVRIRPIKDQEDPFSLFAGLSVYYAVVPDGYFGSTAYEALLSLFSEYKGEEVVELSQKVQAEDGSYYYDIPLETLDKYGILDYYYHFRYTYNGIDSEVYVSEKQPDGYYYAYSLNFNVVVKVTDETIYFLNWSPETFIQRQMVYLKIDDCAMVSLEGSYYDLGILNPDRKGEVSVNESYYLTNTGVDLVVTDSTGKTVNTNNFREFYRILLLGIIRDEVSEEEIKAAMQNEPIAKMTIQTRKSTVYETDAAGNATSKVDYVLESVQKIFRYYELSNGRVLCTIEKIDAEGNSLGETGNFYLVTSRVEEMLSAAVDLQEGITIDSTQRH